MNRENIIRMAREAGFDLPFDGEDYDYPLEFERFFQAAYAAGASAEREACAKHAEEFLTRGRSPLGRAVGDAIRARGQA